jgi:Domain of unknown function (DUF4270)
MVPAVDNINTFQLNDSDITVLTKSVLDDSLITSSNIAPVIAGMGTVNVDPYFGKTNAGIYFQVVPPVSSYNFPVAASAIDSVVLVLPYSGFTYGDTANTTQTQRFTAYRMLDTMSLTSNYYNFSKFNVDRTNPLGSVTANIYNLKNDVVLKSGGTNISVAPHLRIRLNNDIKEALVDSTLNYGTYVDFLNWFRGIYVEPDTNQSGTSIPYFRLDGTDNFTTASVLFYMQDSVISSFAFNTTSTAHSNWVSRIYTGFPAVSHFSPSITNDSILLIQNEPGAKADIRITNLRHMDTLIKQSLINKAEILLTKIDVNGSSDAAITDSRFAEPASIVPDGIQSDGTVYTILDRYPVSSTTPIDFIDGKSRSVTVGAFTVTQYSINFPRELQQALIQGRSELHLRLRGARTYNGAFRLVAGGRSYSNGTYSLRVNVVYSKIH